MRSISAAGLTLALASAGAYAQASSADLAYGVTLNQTLVTFNAATPGSILSGIAISGLEVNEQILGIDFRPSTGELFGLGSFSNLYVLNTTSGAATAVGSGFTPSLNGATFGFDFNPTIDRIRVVSEVNQNLVLNPNTGEATVATPLFYAMGDPNEGANPNVGGSAYDNNVLGAMTSQLYGLDTGLGILVRQANNAGTLETVGPLGIDLSDVVGFDISGVTGIAYAAIRDAQLSQTTFWTIDLNTGLATSVGEVGGGAIITSLAIIPTPSVLGAVGIAGVALLRRRR